MYLVSSLMSTPPVLDWRRQINRCDWYLTGSKGWKTHRKAKRKQTKEILYLCQSADGSNKNHFTHCQSCLEVGNSTSSQSICWWAWPLWPEHFSTWLDRVDSGGFWLGLPPLFYVRSLEGRWQLIQYLFYLSVSFCLFFFPLKIKCEHQELNDLWNFRKLRNAKKLEHYINVKNNKKPAELKVVKCYTKV